MWCVQCGEPKQGEPQPEPVGNGTLLIPIDDGDLKPADGDLKPAAIPTAGWHRLLRSTTGPPVGTTSALSLLTKDEIKDSRAKPRLTDEQ